MESCDERTVLLVNNNDCQESASKEVSEVISNEKQTVQNNVHIGVLSKLAFVFLILVVGCSAEFGSAKVIPLYLYQRLQNAIDNDTAIPKPIRGSNVSDSKNSGCRNSLNEDHLQHDASDWLMYLKLTEDGVELFGLTILGVMSDFIGRKPLIILTLIGITLRYSGIAFVIYMNLNIGFLFIPYAVAGLIGNNSVFYIAMFSIIADITERDNTRTIYMALFDLVLGIGVAGSQIAVGYLIKLMGYLFQLLIATGMCFIAILPSLLFIPETVKREKHMLSFTNASKNFFSFYSNKTLFRNWVRWRFNVCLLAYMCFRLANYSTNIDTLYELAPPFCWSTESIGFYSGVTSFLHLAVGLTILKLFHYCTSDESIAILGCLSAISYRVITSFANQSWMLYLASATGIMSVSPIPILRAIVSRMVHKKKQGALFANLYIVDVICKLSSSSIFSNVYAETQDFMRGFTYLLMAGCYFICLLLFIPLVLTRCQHKASKNVIIGS